MNERKLLKNWVGEGFHPALCHPAPGATCPRRGRSCAKDVKLLTITGRRVHGYNIREESLTRGGSELWSPDPLPLQKILDAAGMFPRYTLADWYPLELQKRWARDHAAYLSELRRDGPLTKPDPVRRRELHVRALADLKPARSWFLLKELIEPGDLVLPIGGRGPARSSTCCVQEVV